MNTMKAIGLYHALPMTDPKSLRDVELEKLTPQGRDLFVHVKEGNLLPFRAKQQWNNSSKERE